MDSLLVRALSPKLEKQCYDVLYTGEVAACSVSKDLPRPRITDPDSNFSDRVYVYRKVRFPNANSEIEMTPVISFLQSLKDQGYARVHIRLRGCTRL